MSALRLVFDASKKAFEKGHFWTARLDSAVRAPAEEMDQYKFILGDNALALHIAERRSGGRPKVLLNDLGQILTRAAFGPSEVSELVVDDHGGQGRRERTGQRIRRGRGQ
jgi:hypothetical protein